MVRSFGKDKIVSQIELCGVITMTSHIGDWFEDFRDGFGVMVYSDTKIYEGEWVKDQRHGWGRMSYSDGSYYEGDSPFVF